MKTLLQLASWIALLCALCCSHSPTIWPLSPLPNVPAPLLGGELQWSLEVPGGIEPGAVLCKDHLVLLDERGELEALDPVTGTVLWHHQPTLPILSSLVCEEARLTYGTANGVFLLDVHAPQRPVFFASPEPVRTPPLLRGQRLVFAWGQHVSLIDLSSGTSPWTYQSRDPVLRLEGIEDRLVLVRTPTRFLAIELTTGFDLWQHQLPDTEAHASLGRDDILLATGTKLRSLDPATGELRSERQLDCRPTEAPRRTEAAVLVRCAGLLFSLGPEGEKPVWSLPLASRGADLVLHDRLILTSDPTGHLAAWHRRSGRLLWTSPFAPTAAAPPALGEDQAFVVTSSGSLIALELDTAAQRWRHEVGRPLSHPPMLHGDRAVLVAGSRNPLALVGIDLARGAISWHHDLVSPPVGAPAQVEDVLLLSTSAGLEALDLTKGTRRWLLPAKDRVSPPAVTAALNRFLILRPDGLVALDPRHGTRLWSTALGTSLLGPLAEGRGLLFGITAGEQVRAFSATTGTPLWLQDLSADPSLPPAIFADRGIVATREGNLHCFVLNNGGRCWTSALEGEAIGALAHGHPGVVAAQGRIVSFLARADGKLLWQQNLEAPVSVPPLFAADLLILGRTDGVVSAHDVRDGTLRWSYPTGAAILARPILEGTTLFIASRNGTLYALR